MESLSVSDYSSASFQVSLSALLNFDETLISNCGFSDLLFFFPFQLKRPSLIDWFQAPILSRLVTGSGVGYRLSPMRLLWVIWCRRRITHLGIGRIFWGRGSTRDPPSRLSILLLSGGGILLLRLLLLTASFRGGEDLLTSAGLLVRFLALSSRLLGLIIHLLRFLFLFIFLDLDLAGRWFCYYNWIGIVCFGIWKEETRI